MSRILYSLYARRLAEKMEKDILVDDFSPFSPTFSFVKQKTPLLCVLRNFFGKEVNEKHKVLGHFVRFVETYCLRRYGSFLVFSPSMEHKMKLFLKKNDCKRSRIFRLHRGMDISLFAQDTVKRKKNSRGSGEEDYILFLGRVEIYQKGIDILLKAYSIFKDDLIRHKKKVPKLFIAGNASPKDAGAMRSMAKQLDIEKDIQLVGRVEGKKKVDILKESLFVVMPSRYESWGVVAIEAAAAGKAVIGSDIPGLRDAIVDGKTGLLFHHASNLDDSAKDLSKKMLLLYGNNVLKTKLETSAKIRAQGFDWSNILKGHEKIYKDLSDV
jgi:glycosyltransferase involved in cell wall biosynthesis